MSVRAVRLNFDSFLVGAWFGVALCLLMVYIYQLRLNYLKSIQQPEPTYQQDCCHEVESVKTT